MRTSLRDIGFPLDAVYLPTNRQSRKQRDVRTDELAERQESSDRSLVWHVASCSTTKVPSAVRAQRVTHEDSKDPRNSGCRSKCHRVRDTVGLVAASARNGSV